LRRQRSNYRSPSALFLNLQGNAVSKTRLTAVFAEAFRAAGVAGSLHWLRHYLPTPTMSGSRMAAQDSKALWDSV